MAKKSNNPVEENEFNVIGLGDPEKDLDLTEEK